MNWCLKDEFAVNLKREREIERRRGREMGIGRLSCHLVCVVTSFERIAFVV